MPINSSEIIGFPKSDLGIRVNLGVKVPKKLTEENLLSLFKDIFFYSTKGLYLEESMLMNMNHQVIDESSYFLSIEELEEKGIPVETILLEYFEKFEEVKSWDLEKKWFALIIFYSHYLLSKDKSKEHLLTTIDKILEKENDEIDFSTIVSYANAINLSLSLLGKEYLIPRFSSLLDIQSDLYEEIFEDNMILFLDYQKELMDIIKKHLTIKDIDTLYGSKNYSKWYSFYDELFEDFYRFNQSSIIFSMANLNDNDFLDLEDVICDDLFASFGTMLDIDDKQMNDLIEELSENIISIYKEKYAISTPNDDVFDLFMNQVTLEFETK